MKAGTLTLKENWNIKLVDAVSGKLISEDNYTNAIMNVGREQIAKLINKISSTGFDVLALGTGTTAASATDTELETEVTRETATTSNPSTYVARFYKEFTFGSTYAISEAGIFDSTTASGSLILSRVIISPAKNVSTSVNLQVTADITVGTV